MREAVEARTSRSAPTQERVPSPPPIDNAMAEDFWQQPYDPASPPATPATTPVTLPPTSSHRFIEKFPGPVGTIIGKAETTFERLRREQDGLDAPIWHPFTSLHEWQFARWITKNLGQSQTDSLLKLPLFKEHYDLSFHNSYSLMKRINQLPTGPDWTCELVHIKGDHVDETGKLMAGDAELWMRDPLECIRELTLQKPPALMTLNKIFFALIIRPTSYWHL
ncbi:hypothetical protein BC834DRAFT_972076 [Gloeopeniophorella convolvens]|nr:hypothetical protein BC834DRAFT_972076 [Gloeopeniophorella convolvens]